MVMPIGRVRRPASESLMTEVMPNPASGRAAKAAAVPDGDLFPLVPEADVLDGAGPASDDAAAVARLPFDADPADAYEQRQLVPLDDDDYR
jgi:hypothetical protein